MRKVMARGLLAVSMLVILASASLANEALIRVYFDDFEHLKSVVSEFDDVAAWGGRRYADISVPHARVEELQALAPNNEILIADIQKEMLASGILGVGSAYHTYEEAYAEMDSVADANPTICMVVSLGQSLEGRQIWAMKISDNVSTSEEEPSVLYMGNHHARELITVEIPLYIMYYLVDNYGTDSRVTGLVDNREIWIVPTVNPDGREYVQNYNSNWRKNRRNNGDGTYGVDTNRNYGYMWGYDDEGSSPETSDETYRGTAAFSEPETQVIRDFCEDYGINTCISFHSYGNLILYPWGYVTDHCPDDAIFGCLADSMASFNGYTYGAAGEAIYITNGDSDDWMYGEQTSKDKMFSYTIEVGSQFAPPVSNILTLCQNNLEPSLLLADYADGIVRILLPATPELDPLSEDADGNFTVAWTSNSDLENPSVAYALVERTGETRVTDNLEGGTGNWAAEKFTLSTTRYYSSSHSYFGGKSNNRNATLAMRLGLDAAATDTLRFWCWYDIEDDWDYAYVEVSTDGGASYECIPGNITTTYDPYGQNAGYGITGSSSAWVQGVFPLGAYAGETIRIRFRYWTDGATTGDGFYVDNVTPVETFTTSTILADDITETHYDLTRAVGTYYYEVRAQDDDGQWGYLSQRETLTVTGAGVPDVTGGDRALHFANPARVGEKVVFSAGSKAGSEINIFDAAGRLVKSLSIGATGEASWDLRCDGGRAASPGIYFVSGADRSERAKLVVLK
jgi:hypothetical protein